MRRWIGVFLLAALLIWGLATPKSTASAASTTGWKNVKGHLYYYTSKGKSTGWQTIKGKKYYFASTGAMATGLQTIGGKKYYFASTGAMTTGLQTISGKKYYFASTGAMATGLQTISGKKYYFASTGAMATGLQTIAGYKYYFGSSGVMATGWQSIAGKQYYFYSTGKMAVNTTINGKTVGSDGAVVDPVLGKVSGAANTYGLTFKTHISDYSGKPDGRYEVWLNNKKIGEIGSPDSPAVYMDKQYPEIAEALALELGFDATPAEIKNLVDQTEKSNSILLNQYNGSCQINHLYPWDSTNYLFILWSPKDQIPAPTPQVAIALHDIQASGAVARTSINGGYNIFKNDVYIGHFEPSSSASYNNHIPGSVVVNSQYPEYLEMIALDLGINNTADELKTFVEQVKSAPKDEKGISSVSLVMYDGVSFAMFL
jgi:YHS domain-containing protein